MSHLLIQADARRIPLADGSIHCCVTSPPYWGLRDYGTATWQGGDPACDHKRAREFKPDLTCTLNTNRNANGNHAQEPYRDLCGKCGARRIDAQLGLEPTPEAFVANMVAVFREVKRVLRDDGTCWVNLGDSYAHNGACGGDSPDGARKARRTNADKQAEMSYRVPPGLKPKDLVGIPWRVAFALQADGWFLRSDIIWYKPNPMPESVRDRPTKSHEYVFLLTKRARYYYDADAVREKAEYGRREWTGRLLSGVENGDGHRSSIGTTRGADPTSGRNSRSVWTITPKPLKMAHFATFPPALVERCVKAGTSERGACPTCGAPWERVTETSYEKSGSGTTGFAKNALEPLGRQNGTGMAGKPTLRRIDTTLGWRPTCTCPAAEPVPCVVFDPFSGSGTTGVAALALKRHYIGCDLSADYLAQARRRIERPHQPLTKHREQALPLFAHMEDA